MTGVAVFDIDGTLTNTFAVDIECYERAVREVLGFRVPADWADWDEITDSAILARACAERGRPEPDRVVEGRVAARMAELLETALSEEPERFSAVPGATEVFALLRAEGWRVAMATGAWRPSAELKLRAGGIPHHGVPLMTSSEHRARHDIIRGAVEATGAAGARAVYFGDGTWDGRAARTVGCAFIGVGGPERVPTLREVGARAVIPDFEDAESILELLAAV